MGKINRFDLNRMIRDFRTTVFFETGTFRGDGIAYALQSSFKKVISVEIVPEIALQARQRFLYNDRIVKIIADDSVTALDRELRVLEDDCIFWLDAHFPGADAGMTKYDAELNESVRLPLQSEAEIISSLRQRHRDIIIMDDLRIYEDGPFVNGNVPTDALPKMERNIDFVYRYFDATHTIHRLYQEEGYLLLLPRPRRWSFTHFFGKPKEVNDYLMS